MAQRWNDWHTAATYQSYVEDFPIYRQLNAHLAELACLQDAKRVLDLASGTGATAKSCLQILGRDSELVGVDFSDAMVGVARAEVGDPRASFRVSAARDLEGVVKGPFDRAVCNAAFWQLPRPNKVLAVLARVLSPGALFVFNIPAERFDPQVGGAHPFQIALSRALAHTLGSRLDDASNLDRDQLESSLVESGFDLVDTHRFTYTGRQEELVELMRIPAMMASVAPEASPVERQNAVDRASRVVDPDLEVEVPWLYFRARRRPVGAPDNALIQGASKVP